MCVAGSDNPLRTALSVKARWQYILGLARGARAGIRLDDNFPGVMDDPDGYAERAEQILGSLEEWLQSQPGRPVGDI